MHYIENADLREWVKEKLRKTIFQKAHALAVQTGCEILVKLDDTTETTGSQYYATNSLQRTFKQSGIRQKAGDRVVCGNTGQPVTKTVDIATQSGTDVSAENDVAFRETNTFPHSVNDNNTNCSVSPACSDTKTDGNIIPLHLTVTSDGDNEPSQSIPRTFGSQSPGGSERTDVVLDYSVKNQGETNDTKATEIHPSEPLLMPSTANNVAVETEQSSIAALLQRPGLLEVEDERYTCQMCSRSFPKQQLLRDHISRSHMQPSMPLMNRNESSLFLPGQSSHHSTMLSALPGGEDHPKQQSDLEGHTDATLGGLPYPTLLPTFSPVVQAALTDGTIHQVWDQFIREATQFYFPEMPQEDGKARLAYQNIGRTMYEKYPCIQSDGQTPWSHFNKNLSSKIRWRRQKRKYLIDTGGGSSRPAKRPNSTPSPSSSSTMDDVAPASSIHSEEDLDVKPDVNELNRQILIAQQHHQPPPSQLQVHLPSSEPCTSAMSPQMVSTALSPPMLDLGIPAKGLKKNILMQTGFYLTPELAAMGFSSTLQMTPEKVKPLLQQMSKEGYGIWVQDPANKDKCGFIKWYPLNEKQQDEVKLSNEQYKRACVAKPSKPRVLSKEMEQFFDAWGGRKVRQNMSLL